MKLKATDKYTPDEKQDKLSQFIQANADVSKHLLGPRHVRLKYFIIQTMSEIKMEK